MLFIAKLYNLQILRSQSLIHHNLSYWLADSLCTNLIIIKSKMQQSTVQIMSFSCIDKWIALIRMTGWTTETSNFSPRWDSHSIGRYKIRSMRPGSRQTTSWALPSAVPKCHRTLPHRLVGNWCNTDIWYRSWWPRIWNEIEFSACCLQWLFRFSYSAMAMKPFSGITPQTIPIRIPSTCRAQYMTSKNSSCKINAEITINSNPESTACAQANHLLYPSIPIWWWLVTTATLALALLFSFGHSFR